MTQHKLFHQNGSDLKEFIVDAKTIKELDALRDPNGGFAQLLKNPQRQDKDVANVWQVLSRLGSHSKITTHEVYDSICCYQSAIDKITALARFDRYGGDTAIDITHKRLYTQLILRDILLSVRDHAEFIKIADYLKEMHRRRNIAYFSYSRGVAALDDTPSKNWNALIAFIEARIKKHDQQHDQKNNPKDNPKDNPRRGADAKLFQGVSAISVGPVSAVVYHSVNEAPSDNAPGNTSYRQF